MTTPVTAATHDWRPIMKRRVAVVSAVLAFWVAGIEAKLVYLQIFDRADLVARAERQQERTQPSPAKRGDALRLIGRHLALDVRERPPLPEPIGDRLAVFRLAVAERVADLVRRVRSVVDFRGDGVNRVGVDACRKHAAAAIDDVTALGG